MAQDNETQNKFSGVLKSLPEFEISAEDSAFVILDMQYLDAHRDYGMGAEAKELGTAEDYDYFFTRIEEKLIPNIQKVQAACREKGIEVIFVRIASLVNDCRDVSPIHKRLKLFAPANSKEAEILEEIKPLDNELVITKGCSGAFNGTNLDQILATHGAEDPHILRRRHQLLRRDLGQGRRRPGLQRDNAAPMPAPASASGRTRWPSRS